MTALHNAMRAFVESGGDRRKMSVPAWAATYPPATVEDVRKAWEDAATAHSLRANNTYEEPEGK
jgi:hypothetical protein